MAVLKLVFAFVSLLLYSSLTITVFGSHVVEDGLPTYRVINGKNGNTCILLKADGLVEVKFMRHKWEEEIDSFIPDKALVGGSCTGLDANMNLSWNGYTLVFNFAKSSGEDLWHISKVTLTLSPDHPQFRRINKHGRAIKLYHMKKLIPTPIGKSYSREELEIPLEPYKEDSLSTEIHGSVLLRIVQVQPFMNNTETFEYSVKCNRSDDIGKKQGH